MLVAGSSSARVERRPTAWLGSGEAIVGALTVALEASRSAGTIAEGAVGELGPRVVCRPFAPRYVTALPTSTAAVAGADPADARRDIRAILAMVDLPPLMDLTEGAAGVTIGLVDGPVALDHRDLPRARIRVAPGAVAVCSHADAACAHGTFVAGILSARRDRGAAGVCPGCTLLVRPVFAAARDRSVPAATPAELGAAVTDCIDAGARLVNLSAAVQAGANQEDQALAQALDLAARRGVLVIAAAGNRRTVAGSMLTRHPAVIPVAAYSDAGHPLDASDAAASIGLRGIGAPGADVPSLAPGGGLTRMAGTSAATPFVTGTAALIWSLHPPASAGMVRFALLRGVRTPRRGIVPPLLHASTAKSVLETLVER